MNCAINNALTPNLRRTESQWTYAAQPYVERSA